METLTTVLLFAIGVFLIGNILLLILKKTAKSSKEIANWLCKSRDN